MVVLAVALPNALFLDPEDFFRLAARALHYAVWPAKTDHEALAVVEISEVQNGFLEAFGCVTHTMIMHLSA